jgi:benzoyl-CoA reductase subunit C
LTFEQIVAPWRAKAEGSALPGAAEWKRAGAGRRAVGLFPVWAAPELVEAAGMLPVFLYGSGARVEIAHADARIQSFVCNIARSALELGLTDEMKSLDAVIFPSICDVAKNLAGLFRRSAPHLRVIDLHLPQNVLSPSAPEFFTAELARILAQLCEVAGRPAGKEELAGSLRAWDESRHLFGALYALRRRAPWDLTATECFALLRAGAELPRREHNHLLRASLDALSHRGGRHRDRVPVVVQGAFCEQPPLALLEVLEEVTYIVDDDLLLGLRFFEGPVHGYEAPLEALARAYLKFAVSSSVRHDAQQRRGAALVEKVRGSGAKAVVFLAAKFCEPALFDQPLQRAALDAAGIQHLTLEFEERMGSFDAARAQAETFAESILFYGA